MTHADRADPAIEGKTGIAERLAAMRGDLLRFARMQLRDRDSAEDAVQDALTAALAGVDRFDGRSSAKTWVFGILRNKIVDRIRARTRQVHVGDGDDDASAWDRLFDERRHWQPDTVPKPWREPDAAIAAREFHAVLEQCMERLPAQTARAFAMREMLGLDTNEICSQLGITSNNFHVCMHRARLVLRDCLEARWFRVGEAS